MHPVILELLVIDRVYYLMAKAGGWPGAAHLASATLGWPAWRLWLSGGAAGRAAGLLRHKIRARSSARWKCQTPATPRSGGPPPPGAAPASGR